MGTALTAGGDGSTRPVPELGIQVLRRCPKCHAPHPLARKPAIDSETCPDCGHPVPPPGEEQIVEAVFSGMPWARFCLWMGDALRRLAKRI